MRQIIIHRCQNRHPTGLSQLQGRISIFGHKDLFDSKTIRLILGDDFTDTGVNFAQTGREIIHLCADTAAADIQQTPSLLADNTITGHPRAGFKAESAEVSMIPSTKADLDAETAPKLMRLIDMLEDSDDVQEVYHNGDISDEVAALL